MNWAWAEGGAQTAARLPGTTSRYLHSRVESHLVGFFDGPTSRQHSICPEGTGFDEGCSLTSGIGDDEVR